MRPSVVPAVVIVCALAAGCGDEPNPPAEPGSEVKPQAVEWNWPLTREQINELRDMDRESRKAILIKMIPPTYELHRLQGRIVLDGVMDEPDWGRAAAVKLRNGRYGGDSLHGTTVRMLWDDGNLYLGWECADPDLTGRHAGHDDPLWQEDVVEVFIDVAGEGTSYVELQVSARNTHFDAIYGDFRAETDFMREQAWERFVEGTPASVYQVEGMKSAVKLKGTLNESADQDEGYVVEWVIPFASLRGVREFQPTTLPIDMREAVQLPVELPRAGTVWRMNLMRGNPSAPGLRRGEASMWSPTTGNVHVPYLFGKVMFVGD